MALISGAVLVQGPFIIVLEWVGKLWPLALIAGGAAILIRAGKMKDKNKGQIEIPAPDEIDVDKLKADEA